MKKVLSLVLVLTLVLGSFSFAFAAPANDVAGTEFEEAVKVLTSLNVLTGFPDGTFRPNETITRAQFAAIMVRVSGMADAAGISKGATVFTDVPATHWASGEINIASKVGIVNGRGDGTFGPDDAVTYDQAVTMIVRSLGYEPMAQKKGGYPYGHLSIASEKEITKDVKGTVGLPAARGLVAQILYKSLDVNMMKQASYGDLEQYVESDETFLSKLGVGVYKAKIASVNEKKETLDAKYWNSTSKSYATRATTLKVASDVVAKGLEESAVELWVKVDRADSTKNTVINIIHKSEVIYDYIAGVTYDIGKNDPKAGDDEAKSIKFRNIDTTFDLAQDDNDNFLVNLERSDVTSGSEFTLKGNIYAKAVLENDEIISLDLYEMTEAGLITKVEDDILTYIKGDNTRRLRDLDDADSILVLVNDQLAKYEDLDEEMYFEYYENDGAYVFVATNKTLSGELDRVKKNSADNSRDARIDGTYTRLAGTVYVSTNEGKTYSGTNIDDLLKEEVFAYLNTKGQIAYAKAKVDATTTSFYGFLTSTNKFDERVRVQRNVDGALKSVTYDTSIPSNTTGVKYDLLAPIYDANGDVNATTAMDSFYKFYIDDKNVVVKVVKPDEDSFTTTAFNAKGDFIDTTTADIYVEDAVIFNANDKTDISLLTWKGIEGTGAGAAGVVFSADDAVASYIVITNDNGVDLTPEQATRYVGFVTGKYRVDSKTFEYDIQTAEGKVTYTAPTKDGEASLFELFVYEIVSEDDAKAKYVASAVYDELDTIGNNYVADFGQVAEDGVDGNYITVGSKTLRVAKDALIIQMVDVADEDYRVADLTDIYDESATVSENDTVYYLVKDGQIRALFFQRAE